MLLAVGCVPREVPKHKSGEQSWQAVGDVLAGVLEQVQIESIRAGEARGRAAPLSTVTQS